MKSAYLKKMLGVAILSLVTLALGCSSKTSTPENTSSAVTDGTPTSGATKASDRTADLAGYGDSRPVDKNSDQNLFYSNSWCDEAHTKYNFNKEGRVIIRASTDDRGLIDGQNWFKWKRSGRQYIIYRPAGAETYFLTYDNPSLDQFSLLNVETGEKKTMSACGNLDPDSSPVDPSGRRVAYTWDQWYSSLQTYPHLSGTELMIRKTIPSTDVLQDAIPSNTFLESTAPISMALANSAFFENDSIFAFQDGQQVSASEFNLSRIWGGGYDQNDKYICIFQYSNFVGPFEWGFISPTQTELQQGWQYKIGSTYSNRGNQDTRSMILTFEPNPYGLRRLILKFPDHTLWDGGEQNTALETLNNCLPNKFKLKHSTGDSGN